MARAPDLITYVSEASDPSLITQAEARRLGKDTVPYAGSSRPAVFNQPGGSDTNIQFNSSGSFGGDGAFTFNTTTKAVNLTGNLNIGGLINGKFSTNFANFKISGGESGQVISTNGNGTLSWRTVASDLPSDWNATTGTQVILNKPTIPSITGLATETYVSNSIANITIPSITGLATVAYVDNKATWANISGKPTFSTVAASGEYKDLIWPVYQTIEDLPDATTNHGMFAHVHAEGHGYMAHAGTWVKLGNYSDIPGGLADLSDVTITGAVSGQVLKYNGTAWVNDTDATGGGASTGNITFTGDNIGSTNDIVNIIGNSYAELQSNDNYIWVEETSASIQINGYEWKFNDNAVLTLANGANISQTTPDGNKIFNITPPETSDFEVVLVDGNARIQSDAGSWKFDKAGITTLPKGSTLGETTTTTVITPPGASAGQSLVIRPTSSAWSVDSSGFIVYGSPITISVNQNAPGNYFGTVNYEITGTGVTEQSLGRPLTGHVVFTGTMGPVTESVTWTIPTNSNITEFTFTLTTVDGTASAGPGETDPALYYNFEYNALPAGNYATVTNNGISNSDANHIHLVAGNTTTTDIYLGDDDQYVKIEKNAGNVVVGTNTNTHQWTFGTDGVFTIPGNGGLYYQSGAMRVKANANIEINAYDGAVNHSWVFGQDGNIILPSNTSKINYANGTSILDGLSSGGPTLLPPYKGFRAHYGRMYNNSGDENGPINKLVIYKDTVNPSSAIDTTTNSDDFQVTGLTGSDVVVMLVVISDGTDWATPTPTATLTTFVEDIIDYVVLNNGVPGEVRSVSQMKDAFYNSFNDFKTTIGNVKTNLDFFDTNNQFNINPAFSTGSGATFNGISYNMSDDTISLGSWGQGAPNTHNVGDTYVIPGNTIQDAQGNYLATPANDVTVTVTAVSDGFINTYSVTGTLPRPQEIWPDHSISDGGDDEYDGGNAIHTNLATDIPYNSGDVVSSSSAFGGGDYVVTYKNGIFGIFATNASIDVIGTSGDSGGYGNDSSSSGFDGDGQADTGGLYGEVVEATPPSKIANGTSYANIAAADGNLVIGINNTSTWTFGTDGELTLPATGMIVEPTTQNVLNLNRGGEIHLRTFGTNDIQLSTDWDGLGGSWFFGSNGILTAPGAITGPGGMGGHAVLRAPESNSAVLENNARYNAVAVQDNNITVQTSADAGSTFNTWAFGTNGELTLPAGGDIKDSTGTSVLGITSKAEPSFDIKTASFDAASGSRYGVGTTSSTVTATLPAVPQAGDAIYFVDAGGAYATNNLIIEPNGGTIMGTSGAMTVSVNDQNFGLMFNGTTWRVY